MLRYFSILILLISGCKEETKNTAQEVIKKVAITCDENACFGAYEGPEFVNRSDVAHQFSNQMSREVGNKLKELYTKEQFTKVDFENIVMTTQGMGSGNVAYYLFIPFIEVSEKCDAFTSFDHVGGWRHSPELTKRKQQLLSLLLPDDSLDISTLKTTPEGLQEYWIQWRHKDYQGNCVE